MGGSAEWAMAFKLTLLPTKRPLSDCPVKELVLPILAADAHALSAANSQRPTLRIPKGRQGLQAERALLFLHHTVASGDGHV